MIFATFGTASPFPRLLARLEELAAQGSFEIVAQTGTTERNAAHCRMFDYAPSLTDYFKRASLVISHAGLGSQLELLKNGIPFVVVPRLARYGEHNDDHQLETCEILHAKYGILYFPDTADLTPELLNHPPAPYPFTGSTLSDFRTKIHAILTEGGVR